MPDSRCKINRNSGCKRIGFLHINRTSRSTLGETGCIIIAINYNLLKPVSTLVILQFLFCAVVFLCNRLPVPHKQMFPSLVSLL